MQGRAPSFFRIISTDYTSFLSVLFPIMFGGFSLYFFFVGNDALRLFLPLAILAVVIGVLMLIQRYRTISSVFAEGEQAKGEITGLGFFRGRGVVKYSYTVQGKKQSSDNAIRKNGLTRKLKVGQKVTVFVDRRDPKRAFIQDIYL